VDYTHSPAASNSAAINPVFTCSAITDEGGEKDYPFYWSSTTHANMMNGGNAAYVAFGEALGWMEMPPNSGNYNLLDVHGAGAQRSDPKTGDPANWPYGHGPQGDVIRIFNYARMVRDVDTATGLGENENSTPHNFELWENYPNPFNPQTNISYRLPTSGNVQLRIYNLIGQKIKNLVNEFQPAGDHQINWVGSDNFGLRVASGIYLYRLQFGNTAEIRKMTVMR
jgi:hypothetical protein